MFGGGGYGFGEVVVPGDERADGVVVAELADGEFGDQGIKMPVAANEELVARAFADDGFLLVVPDEVRHVRFLAGTDGFLSGFFALVDVVAEASVVKAEGARARGLVDLVALIAEEGTFKGREKGLNTVNAMGADSEVGKVVVFVVILVFDMIPIALRRLRAGARLIVFAYLGELGEKAGIGVL